MVIREVKDSPPSDLLARPQRPRGLPATGSAQIPPNWRTAIIGLAGAYAHAADQLERLIAWHGGAACSALPVPRTP